MLSGQFAILDCTVDALERLLPTYRDADGDHEGIAFLAGRELRDLTLFTTTIAPNADHRRGYVRCSEDDVAAASKVARQHGLGVLAQVHSHPGSSSVHSQGDNAMVLLPFEGMLSIVVPHYGCYGVRPLHALGVHQFQNGRWVLVEAHSVQQSFRIIPTSADLR